MEEVVTPHDAAYRTARPPITALNAWDLVRFFGSSGRSSAWRTKSKNNDKTRKRGVMITWAEEGNLQLSRDAGEAKAAGNNRSFAVEKDEAQLRCHVEGEESIKSIKMGIIRGWNCHEPWHELQCMGNFNIKRTIPIVWLIPASSTQQPTGPVGSVGPKQKRPETWRSKQSQTRPRAGHFNGRANNGLRRRRRPFVFHLLIKTKHQQLFSFPGPW
ncbi:hypothetical protein FALBO_1637 [Fusarium albosuccineum]|uniref:Uncharacterized protein n=1 Tax=Fusarium albosuccineum TaxID=1237068 RepID=A0A8H4LNG9_9HYPO|nr:hypothetical protein FALBO_1637 [Fusarium albosuccineum]